MKKEIAALLLLSIFFICVGCTEKTREAGVLLTLEPYELPLSELWNLTVNETGVENETAAFYDLMIRIGPQGSPEHIVLNFWGDKGGRRVLFHEEVNRQGHVNWHSSEIDDNSFRGTHPLELLGELEELRLRELTFGEEGLDIEVKATAGAHRYEGRLNNNTFMLKEGGLIPLDLVNFSSQKPWYPIVICKRGYHNVLIKENKTTGESDVIFLPGKEAPCFIIFTEETLSKAETVVYRENKETINVNSLTG